MLLKYVSSYVTKMHEAATSEGLYSSDITGYQAAHSFLRTVVPLEPEMVMQLSNIKVCWTDKLMRQLVAPFPRQTSTHKHLAVNHPHRSAEQLHHQEEESMPVNVKYFAQAVRLQPDEWSNAQQILEHFKYEGHCDHFLHTIGKPGTGKSQVLIRSIFHAIQEEYQVLVTAPVALLAQAYKKVFAGEVTTDTIHGAFNVPLDVNQRQDKNFALNKYDLVVVDEASMVSSPVFNVMAETFNRLNVHPVVIFAGDKCQQQPLQTVDGQVRTTTSIINNGAFTSQNSVKHSLYQQFRVVDAEYSRFLDFIRYNQPSQSQVDEMQEGIVMCPDGPLSDNELWTAFRSHADMSVMTVSRRGAQRINHIVVARQFAGQQPISAISCDSVLPDAEDIPVFRHMEVVITENRDKAASVVNGQDAVVITSHNNTVVLQLPEGDKVFVYPVTRIDGDGEQVTRKSWHNTTPAAVLERVATNTIATFRGPTRCPRHHGRGRAEEENVEFERCVRQGYNACGPVFSSAVQVIALATLLNCPAEFAEKCQRTSETDAYKADPSLVSMKDYLMRGIFKNRTPVRQSGSVWNDDDDVEETTPRHRHSRPRQPAPSNRRWEGRADESDDDDEARPLADAVRSRRQPRTTSTPVRDPATRRVEKKNDDLRKYYHRKINRWDAAINLLLVEKRQEVLRDKQCNKRSYEKKDSSFGLKEGNKNQQEKCCAFQNFQKQNQHNSPHLPPAQTAETESTDSPHLPPAQTAETESTQLSTPATCTKCRNRINTTLHTCTNTSCTKTDDEILNEDTLRKRKVSELISLFQIKTGKTLNKRTRKQDVITALLQYSERSE
ncbi:hypothetical protein ACROYT_G014249 [Oculina patagonica]